MRILLDTNIRVHAYNKDSPFEDRSETGLPDHCGNILVRFCGGILIVA